MVRVFLVSLQLLFPLFLYSSRTFTGELVCPGPALGAVRGVLSPGASLEAMSSGLTQAAKPLLLLTFRISCWVFAAIAASTAFLARFIPSLFPFLLIRFRRIRLLGSVLFIVIAVIRIVWGAAASSSAASPSSTWWALVLSRVIAVR